ncbi:MAG TPA: prolipoprotein diacylglyceryl transferase [Candidatus Acidoferrales bacterium]|nr:prolipoprotein diacylglyceryl transferase [Candidatus Acidoferrales bacterium]
MRPILFTIGDVTVPSFWVAAFLGFFVAFLLVRSEVLRRGYDVGLAYDITLYAYVGGWAGARLFLIPTGWEYFTQDPIGFLLSSSGWVWYGGVIGGAVAAWILSRERHVALLVFADITAPALAMGLGIGRIGCQLAGDGDYGVPTDLPWGMSYPNGVVPTTERVHPAPVYETLACMAIFAYLWRRRRRDVPTGDQFGRYLILAATTRFLIELVRRNPTWLIGLTTAQWMSVGAVVLGVVLLRRGSPAT